MRDRIVRIDLLENGEDCVAHTQSGKEVRLRVAAVRAKTRWERAYTQQTNRVWDCISDHKLMVEPLLSEAAHRGPKYEGLETLTREWVLDYLSNRHRDRVGGWDDDPFFSGAALWRDGQYWFMATHMFEHARKCGWRGSRTRFSQELKDAGASTGKATTIANRSARPWVIEVNDDDW